MSIKGYTTLLFGCSALLFSSNLCAQQQKPNEKPVETRVVEVTRDFKGEITDADRIKIRLQSNDSIAAFKPSFDYTTNPVSMPVFSTLKYVEPAVIDEKAKLKEKEYGYARLGLGAPLSFLADLYLHYRFTDKTTANLYYNHRSYWANATLLTEQPATYNLPTSIVGNNMQNDLGLAVQHHTQNALLTFAADYKNRYLIFHGHDTSYLKYLNDEYPDYINDIRNNSARIADSLGQSYNILTLKAGIASPKSSDEFLYYANIIFGYTHGQILSVNEFIGGINGAVSHLILEGHTIGIGVNTMAYNKGNAPRVSDGIFTISPHYVYQKNKIKLSVGLDIEAAYASCSEKPERDSGKLSTSIYPVVSFTGSWLDYLTVYAHMEGRTTLNTLQKTVLENPYVLPDLAINNTKMSFSITAGVRGRLFYFMGYNVFGSYAAFDNMYYYVNSTQALPTTATYNTTGYLRNNFEVRYQKVKQFTIGADLNYIYSDFEAALYGRYYANSFSDTLAEAWHKPSWKLACDLRYKYDNFTFRLGFDTHGKAPILYTSPDVKREVRELKTSFNLSAQVEYRVNKWITAFVYGNNLINQNYQNYYLYYATGINGEVGATIVF